MYTTTGIYIHDFDSSIFLSSLFWLEHMINGFPPQQVLGIGNEECCLDNDTHIKGIVYLFICLQILTSWSCLTAVWIWQCLTRIPLCILFVALGWKIIPTVENFLPDPPPQNRKILHSPAKRRYAIYNFFERKWGVNVCGREEHFIILMYLYIGVHDIEWKDECTFTDCTRSDISCKVNNLLVRDLVLKYLQQKELEIYQKRWI